ncbi:MAG: hypothetical protein COB50_00540 [Thiotrichales bacterium]|nr:MAG: hypothetical protein COB50_00540 [Thiotrichales bacterium]
MKLVRGKIFLRISCILLLISFLSHAYADTQTKKTSPVVSSEKKTKDEVKAKKKPLLGSDETKKTVPDKKSKDESKAKKKPLFTVSDEPPPGFAELLGPRKLLVDTYYHGKLIGVFNVIMKPGEMQFSNPKKLVMNLKDIKKKNYQELQDTLKDFIPDNSAINCADLDSGECYLNPESIGVVFIPSVFKVYLFVNSKYLPKSERKIRMLGKSTSGLSYLNKLSAIVSGSEGIGLEEHNYSFGTNSIFSYKNIRFNVIGNYANKRSGRNFHFTEGSIEVNQNQYIYKFGVINTVGGLFLGNQKLFGASFSTTLVTVQNKARLAGVPISIFLSAPSQVSVFKDGVIIYTGNYQAGTQFLDTSSFPQGSYPVDIKIVSVTGIKEEKHIFFVKSGILASAGLPQYYLKAGYFMGNNTFRNDSLLPLIENIRVIQGGLNFRLNGNIGLNFSVIGSDEAGILRAGLVYLNKFFQIQPSILISSNKSIGFGGVAQVHYKKLSLNANLTRIFHKARNVTDDFINNKVLNATPLQTSVNANYAMETGSVGFSASLSKTQQGKKSYSYGPRVSYRLFAKDGWSANLTVSANKTQNNFTMLMEIGAHFSALKWNANFTAGHVHNTDGIVLPDVTSTPEASARFSWRNTDATQQGTSINANARTSEVSRSMGGGITYASNLGKARFNINTSNNINATHSAQYSGNLETNLSWTPSAVAIGGVNIGNSAGVIVNINNVPRDATFDIYADGSLRRHMYAKQTDLVLLPSFKTHKISIRSTSNKLFDFLHTNKIVTLYKGNVQHISWTAVRKYVVIGRVVTSDAKPLIHAIVRGGIIPEFTDEQGYIQTEVESKTRTLQVIQDKKKCIITLPKQQTKSVKNFEYLGDLLCKPVK